MNCIVNGRLILKDGIAEGKVLAFKDTITGIVDEVPSGARVIDAGGQFVSPGLVDVHCHGFLGMDASNGDTEEILEMSLRLPRSGVTSWLPTTMTLDWPDLERCFAAIRAAQKETRRPEWRGAQVLGAHAEGPFINPKRKGAQAETSIQPPNADALRPWADVVRLMTIAPEMDGALECVRAARAMGIAMSMGHTDATCAQALAGVQAGIDHATHTFNAMTPLSHREPGVVGAALSSPEVYCELIADTFHVSPVLFGILARLKPERLVLITDSIPVAGLPDGPHQQQGVTVVVDGIRCRFPDGTIAGSALTLDRAVRNFRAYTDVPLWEAVNMASLYPARSIGAGDRKGSIEPGKDADLLIVDEDFTVQATYVRGQPVCGSGET